MAGRTSRRPQSKTEVRRAIRRLHRAKAALNMAAIRREEGPLFRAACRLFGSWGAAIEAAGLDYEQVRAVRQWSPRMVIDELRCLNRHGELTTVSALATAHPRLYGACLRHFGGGREALRAAGIDYDRVLAQRTDRWTRARIIAQIQQRHRRGQTLCRAAIVRDEPAARRFCYAADYQFGTWSRALRAAGFDPAVIRDRDGLWPRRRVLKEIRRRYRGGGLLNTDTMLRENLPLHAAGRRHFGTWRAAVQAAGVDYSRCVLGGIRGWTKGKVRTALQQRIRRNEASADLIREQSPCLYRAAMHYYGTWGAAKRAAQGTRRS